MKYPLYVYTNFYITYGSRPLHYDKRKDKKIIDLGIKQNNTLFINMSGHDDYYELKKQLSNESKHILNNLLLKKNISELYAKYLSNIITKFKGFY